VPSCELLVVQSFGLSWKDGSNAASFSSSTKISGLHVDKVHQHADGATAGTPHLHDPAGLRSTLEDRCDERQSHVNGRHSVSEHYTAINGYNNHRAARKANNGIVRNPMRIAEQSKLINGPASNNRPGKTSDRSNVQPVRNHRSNVDHKNGINRLANGERSGTDQELLRKEDTVNIAANLRQLLRPTVMEKRQENARAEYDAEDINGPYNFRQLLRPTGYLPTESLRKRKGGLLVSNGLPLPKDKVPEKHVKRRAPLAPSQSKLVNGKN